MLEIIMNEEEQAILEACEAFGKQVMEPWVERVEKGENAREVIEQMAELGILGIAAPEELGGINSSWRTLAIAIEKLAEYNEAL